MNIREQRERERKKKKSRWWRVELKRGKWHVLLRMSVTSATFHFDMFALNVAL